MAPTADTTPNRDFIAELDAAIGCQQCGTSLDGSPSDDFCTDTCQQAWTSARTHALSSYVEPVEHPAHARNLVELHSPETCVTCTDGYSHQFVPDYVWAQVRERALAIRQRDLQVIEELRQRDPMARTEFAAVVDYKATRVANAWYGRFPQRFMLGVDPGGDVVGRLPDGRVARVGCVVDPSGFEEHEQVIRNTVAQMGGEVGVPDQILFFTTTPESPSWIQELHETQERVSARTRGFMVAMRPLLDEYAQFMRGFTDGIRDAAAALQPFAEALAPPKPPTDPRERALWLRQNRGTGPAVSARAPRAINPRRGR